MEDLLNKMKSLERYPCMAIVENRTPCDWGITIIEGGVKFFYRDESDFQNGPRRLYLRCNESETFYSDNAQKCTYQAFLAIKVEAPGEDPVIMTSRRTIPGRDCAKKFTFTLAPRETITEPSLSSKCMSSNDSDTRLSDDFAFSCYS